MTKQNQTMQQYNAIYSETTNEYHELNRRLGLSDTESIILYAVSLDENVSQKAICGLSGLSKQTINSAVKKMIREGILESLSGRKNEKLVPTVKGNKIIEEKVNVIVDIENRILQSWTEEEKEIFLELNKRFLNSLKEECDKLEKK
ncbi:DNA-binding transcriptional regulator, MarR family [Lachnospiraceae bacterium KH1T2]|nr:DNA-binding transcriptional regulator, MarR family [Lachnospiraceae bacterium KH1T2]